MRNSLHAIQFTVEVPKWAMLARSAESRYCWPGSGMTRPDVPYLLCLGRDPGPAGRPDEEGGSGAPTGEGGCGGAIHVAGRGGGVVPGRLRGDASRTAMRQRDLDSSPSSATLLPHRGRCWIRLNQSRSTMLLNTGVTKATVIGSGIPDIAARGCVLHEVDGTIYVAPHVATRGSVLHEVAGWIYHPHRRCSLPPLRHRPLHRPT